MAHGIGAAIPKGLSLGTLGAVDHTTEAIPDCQIILGPADRTHLVAVMQTTRDPGRRIITGPRSSTQTIQTSGTSFATLITAPDSTMQCKTGRITSQPQSIGRRGPDRPPDRHRHRLPPQSMSKTDSPPSWRTCQIMANPNHNNPDLSVQITAAHQDTSAASESLDTTELHTPQRIRQ